MHQLAVPIMLSSVTEENRDVYLEQCREAGVARVMLVLASVWMPLPPHLAETVAFFKKNGLEVGIWTDTIGHGSVLTHVVGAQSIPDFTSMVNLNGKERTGTFCPMDAGFRRHIAALVASLAKTGADIVMLDDDFRMSQHGGGLFCACPLHLADISRRLGEEISREALLPFVTEGKGNRYRDAWLAAQNEGLLEMAKEIRAAVDEQNLDTVVCFCTAYSPWNVDNTDVREISRVLAGKHRPKVRLTGAPYWSAGRARRFSLLGTIAASRMTAGFMQDADMELMCEGDVYPRPRYTCPASYLENYDLAIRADGGYDVLLKYMFDYVADPRMETGYLAYHNKNRALHEAVERFFPNGANSGVRVYHAPHTLRYADLSESALAEVSPFPWDDALLGSCGFPVIHRGRGFCASVFGEAAQELDLSLLRDGALLDAISALRLTARGVDVGLGRVGALRKETVSYLCTERTAHRSYIQDGTVKMLSAELAEGATPVLFSAKGDALTPVAYRYENQKGERYLVLLFEAASVFDQLTFDTGLFKSIPMANMLTETLPWLARRPIPAYCAGNPELYLLCEEGEDTLSLLLVNCFADSLLSPTVTLAEEYSHIECVGCAAELQGNRVVLTEELHGFCAAAFRLTR